MVSYLSGCSLIRYPQLVDRVYSVLKGYRLTFRYTKQELGKRLSAFFISQNLGNGFGGLLAAGILKLDGKRGIAGWRWLFIVLVQLASTVATPVLPMSRALG